MFNFIKHLFSNKHHRSKEAKINPCTLDGIPFSIIRNGDHLEWTTENGKKQTGFVMDYQGCKRVQIDAFLSVPLLSIIEKAKFI